MLASTKGEGEKVLLIHDINILQILCTINDNNIILSREQNNYTEYMYNIKNNNNKKIKNKK